MFFSFSLLLRRSPAFGTGNEHSLLLLFSFCIQHKCKCKHQYSMNMNACWCGKCQSIDACLIFFRSGRFFQTSFQTFSPSPLFFTNGNEEKGSGANELTDHYLTYLDVVVILLQKENIPCIYPKNSVAVMDLLTIFFVIYCCFSENRSV